MKVFGKGDIVCSVLVQHLTPQSLDPSLWLLGTDFVLKVANLTVVLWEHNERQLIFDLNVKAAVYISVILAGPF